MEVGTGFDTVLKPASPVIRRSVCAVTVGLMTCEASAERLFCSKPGAGGCELRGLEVFDRKCSQTFGGKN